MLSNVLLVVVSQVLAFMQIAAVPMAAVVKATNNCVDSRRRAGSCTTLAQCPQLIEEFYDNARATSYLSDFQTYVSSSMCGFNGNSFLVCCAAHTTVRPARSYTHPAPTFGSPSSQTISSPTSISFFYFAPLSGSETLIPPNPSVIYPTSVSIPPVVYPNNPSVPPVIYPTNEPRPTTPPVVFQTSTPRVIQPVPPTLPTAPTTNIYQSTPSNPTASVPAPVPVQVGSCGISSGTTNRVVGGAETRRGAYSWAAALGYRDEYSQNALKYLCGGSLIARSYVLTSAHCINAGLTVVRLGAHDLNNRAEQGAVDMRIKRTLVHENFDLRSIVNDIALIELSTPAPSTDYISTICLPEGNNFLTQDFVGMHPFIAGWGSAKHQGPTSNVLRDVQVPIVSRQTCEHTYRSVFQFIEFSDKLICAGNSNVDACQGDSGGPLMMPQLVGGTYRYFLLGVVSYGYECARTGFPGVYTRVASYLSWIRRNTA